MKNLVLMILAIFFLSSSFANSEELKGAFGLELGQELPSEISTRLPTIRKKLITDAERLGYLHYFSVKPEKRHPYFEGYTVSTSDKNLIVSISANGLVNKLERENCEARKVEISLFLQSKYSNHSRKVAEADVTTLVFGDGDYEVSIRCNTQGTRLFLQYVDVFALAKIRKDVKEAGDRHSSL